MTEELHDTISPSFSNESSASATTRLTLKQLRDCEDIFSVFEAEDDTVDMRHLAPMFNALSLSGPNLPTTERIERLSARCKNRMDFCHFIQLVAPSIEIENEVYSPQVIENAFARFDMDGNGYISASELRTILSDSFCSNMKHVADVLTDEDVEEVMLEADLDGDGRISFEEFQEMIPFLSQYARIVDDRSN